MHSRTVHNVSARTWLLLELCGTEGVRVVYEAVKRSMLFARLL